MTIGGIPADAAFDLASLTKLYTTTLLLKLLPRRGVELDARVLTWLDIPESCSRLRQCLKTATIRQLLTHTAGLPAWYPLYAIDGTIWERMECAVEQDQGQHPPMRYSDLGLILAGRLLEICMGSKLPELIERTIRMPLMIPVLGYLPAGDSGKHFDGRRIIVSSYGNEIERRMCAQRGIFYDGFRAEGSPIQGEPNDGNAWYYFKGVSGHAGLFSDAVGVCALGQYYLNTKEALLLEAMQEHGYGRGLGFELGPKYPYGCGHTGFTGTSLYVSRELGVGAVLLTNRLANKTGEAPDLTACRTELHRCVANNAAYIAAL